MRPSLLIAAVAALVPQLARADTIDHTYKNDEHIELWVNKVRTVPFTVTITVTESCGHLYR